MLIDTHCHLNFQAFDNDLSDVVRRAKDAGVGNMIVPGTDIATSKKAVEIAQTYSGCFAAIGIHPHHAQNPNLINIDDLRHDLEELINQRTSKVVAIGEIGLDYHEYQKTKYEKNIVTDEIKQKQQALLLMQLNLGVIHNLPFIFHCREAWPDIIHTISQFQSKNSRNASPKSRLNRDEGGHRSINYINQHQDNVKTNYINPHHFHGVFHCFSGSTQDLHLLTTMGYYIGFDGNITYSSDYSTLVAATPLNKILLETDSPYLTPVPHRGQRNEPANVKLVAEAVAKYKSLPSPTGVSARVNVSEVEEITSANAEILFKLS